MKISLRTKIMGMIVLMGGLLLLLALGVIWTLGYRQRVVDQGENFRSEAAYVVAGIRRVIEADISKLNDLMVLGDVADLLRAREHLTQPAGELEAIWASLTDGDERVKAVLGNPLASRLRTFQEVNPLVVEVLVADAEGRLVAATGKTSDYDQSDETWWQKAKTLRSGEAVLEGLAIDQSAGVYSLDIALPIVAEDGRAVGVLKAVFSVAPLFSGVSVFPARGGAVSEVVSSDGRVLLRMPDRGFVPSGKVFPPEFTAKMHAVAPGWFFSEWNGEGAMLVGYAPIEFLGIRHEDGRVSGPASFVVVHQRAEVILAPLIQRAILLMSAGTLIILGACALTMYFVSRNVLAPLETLRNAAAALASTTGSKPAVPGPGRTNNPGEALTSVAGIRTGDEIEEFAGNFGIMSARLLRYQEDLRREVADKTAAIQSDLDLAREFQQAFLPRDYPKVPSDSRSDPVTLSFQHVYQAALSVSGDFFDIIKLDDSRAGVLIADVMGHGTRSALVTAILRTLLQGLARAGNDPSDFLKLLNRHFHDTMRQTDQLIFVSACFVVFDTHEKTLRFASAGHPSPFLGNRETGQVEPLHGPLKDNPALGLFPDSEYHEFSRSLREGDLLLLYTDGIIEATDEEGVEYGRERLAVAMRKNLDMDLPGFTQAALESVRQFSGYRPPEDDLCVVAVEISANGHSTTHHRRAPHATLLEF